LAQRVFSLARPCAFALHCLPMHGLRRSYGLPSLGFNLRQVYTHADYTLYADIPDLYCMERMPAHHQFIGPVAWSPSFPDPDWWQDLPQNLPLVYVTLGSSGQSSLLPQILTALGQLDITALVSTAGAPLPQAWPDNVYPAAYLPGEAAVKKASLVICNGGSPGTHQALAHGVPVIGVAGNLDQYLNMAAIEKSGAGRVMRSGTFDAGKLVAVVQRMLADPTSREAARDLALRFARYDPRDKFNNIINEIVREKLQLPRIRPSRSSAVGGAP
jgi:UDP:flavonoid glycosyltransferase YjiC (YdhE family)